jgi:hypothetical protein
MPGLHESVTPGYITFLQTLRTTRSSTGQILVNDEPHPEAVGQFGVFCSVTTSALGIS